MKTSDFWLTTVSILTVCLGCSAQSVPGVGEQTPQPDASVSMDANRPIDTPTPDISISLSVTPTQATYAIGSEVEIIGTITRDGRTSVSTDWTVTPSEFGMRTSDSILHLTAPGSGTIELCEENVCERYPIFVVDQPVIQLITPKRGDMLRIDSNNQVFISGRLENFETGFPTVLINGEVAAIDDDFNFSLAIAAEPGLNPLHIEVREPTLMMPPQLDMHFMAGVDFMQFDNGTLTVGDALSVRISDTLLDANLPPVEVRPGERVQVFDIAQLLELIIRTSEPLRWLPDPLTDLEGLNLAVEEIDFGDLSGNIYIPGSAAEGTFSITGAQIRTSGSVDFMGSVLSLDGTMTAALNAFMILEGMIDETIIIDLTEIEADLMSVTADYPSATLNDLLEALDSELTDQVIDVLTNFVKRLFQEQALPLVQFAFEAMLEQIQVLPIVVPSPLEGIPDVELNALVNPHAFELSRGLAHLRVNVDIGGLNEPYEHEGDLGVFMTPVAIDRLEGSTEPLLLVVKLDLLNALCHAIWKTGLLNSTPQIPDSIGALIGAVSVDAKLPPVIQFDPNIGQELILKLVELQLAVTPRGTSSPDLYILNLSVPALLDVQDGFITLRTNGTPDIEVNTLSKSSDSAINAQTIESLLLGAIWPLFQATLDEGLTYGIGSIPIEQQILREIAPKLSSLVLTPAISNNFIESPGVITVGGQLTMEGTIRPTPPPNIE